MKNFLAGVLLLTTSAYGLGTGLEFGAGVTMAVVDFRVANDSSNDAPVFWGFQHFPTQQGLGANLFVSYGSCWCDHFPLALQLDAYILSSDGEYRYSWFDTHFAKPRCRTIVDLSVKPGYLITDCVLLEAKGGIAFAHLRQEIRQEASMTRESFGHASDSRTRVGYVLGAAARLQLGECLSAYAAFDWHAFSGDLATTSIQAPEQFQSYHLRSRIDRAYARTFTLGLTWSI